MFNTNDETRNKIPDEVGELSVPGTHLDRQAHTHHILPFELRNYKFSLNIRSLQERCCILNLSIRRLQASQVEKSSQQQLTRSLIVFTCVITIKIEKMSRTEDRNKLSVTVFVLKNNVPAIRIIKREGIPFDMLILEDHGECHNCPIKIFSGFMQR